jgi:hypothetical protein
VLGQKRSSLKLKPNFIVASLIPLKLSIRKKLIATVLKVEKIGAAALFLMRFLSSFRTTSFS